MPCKESDQTVDMDSVNSDALLYTKCSDILGNEGVIPMNKEKRKG